MPYSSLIGGSFDLISSGLNAAYSAKAQRRAYEYQKRLLELQQSWSERMSNTAHRREVSDLRAAGLNPILSATGGNGASSPVVSAPSVAMPSGSPFNFNNLGRTLANSAEAKQAKTAEKVAESQIKNQNRLTDAQVKQAEAQADLLSAQAKETRESKPVNRVPTGAIQTIIDAILPAADSVQHNTASPLLRGERLVPAGYSISAEDLKNPKFPLGDTYYGKYRDEYGRIQHGQYLPRGRYGRYKMEGKNYYYKNERKK